MIVICEIEQISIRECVLYNHIEYEVTIKYIETAKFVVVTIISYSKKTCYEAYSKVLSNYNWLIVKTHLIILSIPADAKRHRIW